MNDTGLIYLIVPGFLICFGVLWSSIVFLISRLGGWAGLARQYPATDLTTESATESATGKTFRWRSASFGWFSSYRNCLTVTVSLAGLHLRPMIAFRIGHQPMLIPWGAIVGATRRDILFLPAIRLDITDVNSGGVRRITLYGRALIEALAGHVRIH